MKTLAIAVLGMVTFHRSATLLIDVDNNEGWEAAAEKALDRARDGIDVEWNDVKAAPDSRTAVWVQSAEVLDLLQLLTDRRDRPEGLDADEEAWLAELFERVAISAQEIARFDLRAERTPSNLLDPDDTLKRV